MGGWISAFAGMSGTSHTLSAVIAGLDPAIHEAAQQCWQYGFALGISPWMPGTSPGMTLQFVARGVMQG
jgi:hypothetical protein